MSDKAFAMTYQTNLFTYIFSLFGGYVLPVGNEIWIGGLIQALAPLGFNPQLVRVQVSRMKRKGYLLNRRQGRYSFYRLSEQGQSEVQWGGGRAFDIIDEAWDGHWTMVVYSVPEDHRLRRDALREALVGLGFGSLSSGVWISPHPLPSKAESIWDDLEVREYLDTFRVDHQGPDSMLALAGRAWPQLPEIARRYKAFLAEYEPVLRHYEAGDLRDENCFAARLRSLVDFVAINLADPLLPAALLPDGWPRPAAYTLHKQLQRTLAEPAKSFFRVISQPDTKG